MKNKKGFTLIELLAVIVILAIIALIAVPIVLNMINSARKSAARSAALGYIDAIEYNNGFASLGSDAEVSGYTKITSGNVSEITSTLGSHLKGKAPTSGSVVIDANGKVESATDLCFNGYKVQYDGKDARVEGKCSSSSSETQEQLVEETAEETVFAYTSEGEITGFKEGLENQPTEIVIPDKIGGVTITSIGDGAFANKGITSVKISNSVTTIKDSAFILNQITSLDLGNHVVTIGKSAFQASKLKTVTIPNSVQTIDGAAFLSNEIETLSLGNNVKFIGMQSFLNNNLTEVVIPASVETIEQPGVFVNNPNLSTIVNKSGNSYNWCYTLDTPINVNGTYDYDNADCIAETGVFSRKDGHTITVSK